tara:strand:- start:110 stop:805 length:696 start_codon:yes stop_codon:yes gene_type:complete
MDRNNLNLLIQENIQIDFFTFLINLITVTILCFIIQIFYLRYASSLSNKVQFSKNFVILGITTCIVIVIVKNSLALSLGLVGALSIVRFRAAIKEPEELVYLFLVIAAGLGAGAGQTKIITVGIIFSLILIYIYTLIFKKRNDVDTNENLEISVVSDQNFSSEKINLIIEKIKKNAYQIEFVSMSSEHKSTNINLNIKVSNVKKLLDLNEVLKKNFKGARILIARNNDLSL